MSDLRPTAGFFKKIRRLSDLLSGICIPRQAAWSGKIKLVNWFLIAGSWCLAASDNRPVTPNQQQETRITGENNGD